MADIRYQAAPGRELGAYVASPEGGGPWPGVVVVMDALGLGRDIRDQADRLAANGYLAFAPDLYSGRGPRCVVATMLASRSGTGEAYENIEGARRELLGREDCTGRIGIIGFCMGGGFAIMCAPSGGYAAASVNYGDLPRDAARRLAGSCPVVASYGKRDVGMRGRASRLEAALTALGVEHDVKEYPDAGHSFMNRLEAGWLPGPVIKAARLSYHHDSAEDSWRRILAFFAVHLGGPRAAGPDV
jgi:carboxymethylenebutenolidase